MLNGTILKSIVSSCSVASCRGKFKQMFYGSIISKKYIKRTNLGRIPDLALQVYEACLKTCNAHTAQKIVQASTLHGINF